MEKKRIALPIIVEGKYDKNTLMQLFDCKVFITGGFGIFNAKEKQALFRKLSSDGIIVLTDSDGGGKQIRSFLKSIVPKEKLFNLYIPKIEGKEKRKKTPSKEGTLGVEGMPRDVLEKVLSPFIENSEKSEKQGKMITKVDLFCDKLTGYPNSSELRRKLCDVAELPDDMTPNALLEALNLLYSFEEYKKLVAEASAKCED